MKVITAAFCVFFIVSIFLFNSLANANRENKQLTKDLSDQVAINELYQVRVKRLNELDTKHTETLNNAKTEIDKLRDAVSSDIKRVYVKADCAKSATDTTEGRRNEATAQLSETTRQDYFRLREMIAENEHQVLYLQDYIITECLR